MTLGGLVMLAQGPKRLPPAEVESLARTLGMVFPQEVVPFTEKEGSVDD